MTRMATAYPRPLFAENAPAWLCVSAAGFNPRGASGYEYKEAASAAAVAAKEEKLRAAREAAEERRRIEREAKGLAKAAAKAEAARLREELSQRRKAERRARIRTPEQMHAIKVEAGRKAWATRLAQHRDASDPEGLVGARTAAALAEVKIGTVYKATASGRLPVVRIGTRTYMRPDDVLAWHDAMQARLHAQRLELAAIGRASRMIRTA